MENRINASDHLLCTKGARVLRDSVSWLQARPPVTHSRRGSPVDVVEGYPVTVAGAAPASACASRRKRRGPAAAVAERRAQNRAAAQRARAAVTVAHPQRVVCQPGEGRAPSLVPSCNNTATPHSSRGFRFCSSASSSGGGGATSSSRGRRRGRRNRRCSARHLRAAGAGAGARGHARLGNRSLPCTNPDSVAPHAEAHSKLILSGASLHSSFFSWKSLHSGHSY